MFIEEWFGKIKRAAAPHWKEGKGTSKKPDAGQWDGFVGKAPGAETCHHMLNHLRPWKSKRRELTHRDVLWPPHKHLVYVKTTSTHIILNWTYIHAHMCSHTHTHTHTVNSEGNEFLKAYSKSSELSILVERGQEVEIVDRVGRENHWNVRG